jgi:transcriptional regulator with XRE-family HTH domain
MDDGQRRAELRSFLRTRRARLSPLQVGLPAGGRRRTPGLRREELAQLAGVGSTWYTWLEQGRPITVSASVLDNLASALRLDAVERTHLFILARGETPAAPPTATEMVGPAVQQILDALGTYPAYVVNARWDAVAWNEAACRVFTDFAALSPRDRNLLWFMFMHPLARQLYIDWEGAARHILAFFRASTGRYVGETWFTALIAELSCASPAFAAWWPRNDVYGTPREAHKEVNHPLVGRLALQSTPLQIAQAPELCMMVYAPVPGTETAAKLQRLMSVDAAMDHIAVLSGTAHRDAPVLSPMLDG